MITLTQIETDMANEIALANSELEVKMIEAEYKIRIKVFKNEGEEAYVRAYVTPYEVKDDCDCGS